MKCPSCNLKLKSDTKTCPGCGRYCGRTFDSKTEDVFLSESKNPPNRGYTQQQQKNVDCQYTRSADSSVNPYDDLFIPLQPETALEEEADLSLLPEHDVNSNPYECVDNETNSENDGKRPHESEFVATNIVEFGRHMFGRESARKIAVYVVGLLTAVILSLPFDFAVEKSYLTVIFAVVHTIVLTVLSLLTKKKYSKTAANLISIYIILYSALMIVLYKKISYAASDIIIFIIVYTFVAAEDILSLKLFVAVSKLHESWESYKQSGKIPVENEIPEDLNNSEEAQNTNKKTV